MPPSYSMMLPGRMSTPLIFMSSLGESDGKGPRRRLAAGPLSGKQRVRVDRRAVPPAIAWAHLIDREMEVRSGGAGVTAMADAGDHLPALELLALVKPGGVGGQMRVIVNPLSVGRPLVDRGPAKRAVEQFFDRPVRRRDHGHAFARHDVDRVVPPPGRARLVESVGQLPRFHPGDRDGEAGRPDVEPVLNHDRLSLLGFPTVGRRYDAVKPYPEGARQHRAKDRPEQ